MEPRGKGPAVAGAEGGLDIILGVLGFPLTAKVWGGISWATYRLVEALAKYGSIKSIQLMFDETPTDEFARRTLEDLFERHRNVSPQIVGRGKDAIKWAEQYADVVWGPASGILRTKRVPQVFTHHDMRQFTGLSESMAHSVKHRAGLNYAMRNASVAVMVSQNTRTETLARYKGQRYAAKTDTIPWGVPAGFANAASVEPLRPDFIEGHHFITAMYDPFPHKRMDLLERVVPLLDEHGWDLVVLGGMRGGNIDVRIDHPKVHYPGFVDYDLMPRYIKASALFLFTSEYEGFGFPPYEAMSLGVPVLYSSKCAALHDVIGDASHVFSDDEGMVATLGRLMTEDDERVAHVGETDRLVGRFDWRLAAGRYEYLFEVAHRYRDRPIDFTSSEPAPAQRTLPSTSR